MKAEAFASAHLACHVSPVALVSRRNEGGGFRLRAPRNSTHPGTQARMPQ